MSEKAISPNHSNQRTGFSLVELSIVLVILGLLVGGVMSGQSLIKAAELRAVVTEHDRFLAAVNTFRDRYMALPGDMPNAKDFWGEAAAGNACRSTVGTGTQTCNGNGDGIIRHSAPTDSNELFRLWQHLANAGMIEGTYTGVEGSGGGSHALIGENVPKSKKGNSGWTVHGKGTTGNTVWFQMDYGNVLMFGGQHSSWESYAKNLTPEEAWNIDMKMDDGKPGRGSMVAFWHADCTDSGGTATNTDADYLLNESSVLCSIGFPRIF